MKAEMTISAEIDCIVTGTWVEADPSVGQMHGYWDDIEIKPKLANLWDALQHVEDEVVDAIDALERAAEAELETSQEP